MNTIARIVIVLLVMFATMILLGHFFPKMGHVAFVLPVVSVSISWLLLACLGMGGVAVKLTK